MFSFYGDEYDICIWMDYELVTTTMSGIEIWALPGPAYAATQHFSYSISYTAVFLLQFHIALDKRCFSIREILD